MRIFIQKVVDYTGALPTGQKVIFQRDQKTGRAVNALRAGVQFANKNARAEGRSCRIRAGASSTIRCRSE